MTLSTRRQTTAPRTSQARSSKSKRPPTRPHTSFLQASPCLGSSIYPNRFAESRYPCPRTYFGRSPHETVPMASYQWSPGPTGHLGFYRHVGQAATVVYSITSWCPTYSPLKATSSSHQTTEKLQVRRVLTLHSTPYLFSPYPLPYVLQNIHTHTRWSKLSKLLHG